RNRGRQGGKQHGDGSRKRRKEPAHGSEDLNQPIVEAEKNVADPLGVDLPLGELRDHFVFVTKLVVEHFTHRRTERSVAVRVPNGEVLANPVDLDRLEDDLDAERSENARNEGE